MFEDRVDAGKKLAQVLTNFRNKNAIILAIPRGGVVVGNIVAKSLNLPLDVIVARKIGHPLEPELGIGAVSENNTLYLDDRAIKSSDITKEQLNNIRSDEEEELKRRILLYRKGKSLPSLSNKSVILVDDGLATGVSAKAAIEAVKKLNPDKIIFAVPVSGKDTAGNIKNMVDDFVCVSEVSEMFAIGNFYKNFEQVSDEEVINILSDSHEK